MLPTLKLRIAFEQLKKDILGNIIGIGAIAQIRQCDSKHDIPVIFDRLSKSLFFHNHLPVTVLILDEVLTIDTLWPDEMFQIQAGKPTKINLSLIGIKESPPVREGGFPVRAAQGLSLLLYSPGSHGGHIKWPPARAELATNLTPVPPGPGIRRARWGNVPCQKRTGLFWSVLSGEMLRSSGDLLSSLAWKSAAFSEVCGKL